MAEETTIERRELRPQPLDIVRIENARMNIKTVGLLVGYRDNKVWEEVKEGRMPAPRWRGRPALWSANDIRQLLALWDKGLSWADREEQQAA